MWNMVSSRMTTPTKALNIFISSTGNIIMKHILSSQEKETCGGTYMHLMLLQCYCHRTNTETSGEKPIKRNKLKTSKADPYIGPKVKSVKLKSTVIYTLCLVLLRVICDIFFSHISLSIYHLAFLGVAPLALQESTWETFVRFEVVTQLE